MAKDDLTINIKTNVKGAKKDMGDLNKSTDSSTLAAGLLGNSLKVVATAWTTIKVKAKMAFATMKAGMISSGIGALVLMVIAVIQYFKKTQRGAEMLERAMAGLGAVVDVVVDLFSSVGEVLVGAFSDPKQAVIDLWEAIKKNLMNRLQGIIDGFGAAGKVIQAALKFDWETAKEGAEEYATALVQVTTGLDAEQQKAFADGIKNIATEMNNEADAAMRLKGIMQDVRREEMAFSKVQAQTRQEVAKARLDAMDETKTEEERLKAIADVKEKETKMTEGLIELQKKKINAKREENALGESMIEDEEALMALEVELINLTTQSTMTKKRLQTEVEALEIQMASKRKARAKVEAEAAKVMNEEELAAAKLLSDEKLAIAIADAKEKEKSTEILRALQAENFLAEIENLQERALAELEIQKELELEKLKSYENFEELKAEIDEKYRNKADAVNQKFKKKELKWEEMTADQKLGVASSTAGNMAKIMGEETEAGKALAVVQATIDTYRGATAAYASLAGVGPAGPVLGAIAAAAAIVSGLANVKAIMSADSSGGGASPSTPSAIGGGTPRGSVASGAFTLGGGEEPEPVKAFVVTDDMTNNQDKLANIRRRATI